MARTNKPKVVNVLKRAATARGALPSPNVPPPPSPNVTPPLASVITDNATGSTQALLSNKSKDELIDMLVKLIDDENKTEDGKCNSDKIKNMLNDFIARYKSTPDSVPATSKDIDVILDIYADKNKNSKGYNIYNYKVRALNEEYPFSTDDQVKYFLNNLIGYIENSNLPIEGRKEDLSNFFRSYSKTFKEIPILDAHVARGGSKRKSRAKRSQKRKMSNTQKKRKSNKSVKKH